jgi:hypothetical protein
LPALQIEAVLEKPTSSKRREALAKMPQKLTEAFEVTIKRINDQPEDRCIQVMAVIKWAFLSVRQLTITELLHALAVELDNGNSDTLDRDNLPPKKTLTEWCLGLVVLDKEPQPYVLSTRHSRNTLKSSMKAVNYFPLVKATLHGHVSGIWAFATVSSLSKTPFT